MSQGGSTRERRRTRASSRRTRESALRLASPLFVEIDLDGGAPHLSTRRLHALTADEWKPRITALRGVVSVRVIASRLEEDARVDCVVRALEAAHISYWLESDARWAQPRAVMQHLQALPNLHTLRLVTPAERIHTTATRTAVHAGTRVWLVVPLEDEANLARVAQQARDVGAKRVVFRLPVEPHDADRAWLAEARRLRAAGHAVTLEGCRLRAPDAPSLSCIPRPGTVHVDAFGAVRTCAHTPSWGTIIESPLNHLWLEHPHAAHLPAGLAVPETAPATLRPELIPVPLYRLRTEAFGAVAHRGLDFVPLRAAGAAIADALDGYTSLAALRRRHGFAAVALVHALHLRGMVRFRRPKA